MWYYLGRRINKTIFSRRMRKSGIPVVKAASARPGSEKESAGAYGRCLAGHGSTHPYSQYVEIETGISGVRSHPQLCIEMKAQKRPHETVVDRESEKKGRV